MGRKRKYHSEEERKDLQRNADGTLSLRNKDKILKKLFRDNYKKKKTRKNQTK